MFLNKIIVNWLKDTTKVLNISSFGFTKWPKQLIGKEHLIIKLNCSNNRLITLHTGMTHLRVLKCNNNELTTLPSDMILLRVLDCYINKLFSNNLTDWRRLWPIQCMYNKKRIKLRKAGMRRVIYVLKRRLYLPRLNELHKELLWSPNHPGKFFTSIPRHGKW